MTNKGGPQGPPKRMTSSHIDFLVTLIIIIYPGPYAPGVKLAGSAMTSTLSVALRLR